MSSATLAREPAPAASTGFGNTLASEWTKLSSVRATYFEVVLSVLLGLGMTALIALAIGSTFDDLSAEDRATFDPIDTSAFGVTFAVIVLVVLGVTLVASEYTSGMIRLTLATTPRRTRVLVAKLLLITLVSLLAGFAIAFGSFFVGQVVLGAYEGVPSASLSDADARESVIAVWLCMPVFPLLGAAAAVVLRSTSSTITAVLALLFIPAIFGGLLPDVLQENVVKYLPNFAIDSITTDPTADSKTHMDVGPAIGVLAAWLLVFFAAAYLSLTRRDV